MIGYIVLYNFAMFLLYSLTPILFRLSSALFFNLALLSSDFYTYIFLSFVLYESSPCQIYPVAFATVCIGLIIYYINPATKPKIKPDYEDEKHDNENERDLESSYDVNNENDEKRIHNNVEELVQ
ncbi:hypothetical protein C2G38_2138915 [Gigaspora rosea]|uniref:Uncharacterized protein n=1 Tax=Gigaspora rosea TaxID=44941 RepID=A0A397VRF7_9GLOM|nr:hypothetical protein C2G38_2138915 [Gigaspora rosea]